jgi:hypothetical protein
MGTESEKYKAGRKWQKSASPVAAREWPARPATRLHSSKISDLGRSPRTPTPDGMPQPTYPFLPGEQPAGRRDSQSFRWVAASDRGQGISEYALIMSLVAFVCWLLVSSQSIGATLSDLYFRISDEIAQAADLGCDNGDRNCGGTRRGTSGGRGTSSGRTVK